MSKYQYEIEAKVSTWLKRHPQQSSELPDQDKIAVAKGRAYPVLTYDELEDEEAPGDGDGHVRVELGYQAGTWYLWPEHWDLPWVKVSPNTPETKFALPEWSEVNWNDFSCPVSKYFRVGEVTNMSRERIPTDPSIKQNIIKIARHMDEIREWWGGPIAVNSWNRPWHVNRRIGSRAPNHPAGYAVDFRTYRGSVWEMQRRFESEWYNTGKWQGGFGRGAKRGFLHIDLRGRRVWNY